MYLGSVEVYSHPVNDRGGVESVRMRRSIALFSLSLPFLTLSSLRWGRGVTSCAHLQSQPAFWSRKSPHCCSPYPFSRFPKILLPVLKIIRIFPLDVFRNYSKYFPPKWFLVPMKRTQNVIRNYLFKKSHRRTRKGRRGQQLSESRDRPDIRLLLRWIGLEEFFLELSFFNFCRFILEASKIVSFERHVSI